MGLTRKQLAIIHIAKKSLALDDDTYRDALYAHGGARSAKHLSLRGFDAVMRHFKACGFREQERGPRRKEPGKDRPGFASEGQLKKVYASWWSLAGTYYTKGKELKALRAFLKKRFRVDHENFLDAQTARKVIEAIKRIQQRR